MAYSKYKNKKIVIDGITFDSLVEGDYYKKLKEDERYGRIKKFWAHPEGYTLHAGYQLAGERKQSAIKYNADFIVVYNNGDMKVIDVKGGKTTPEFRIKKKLFESKYKMKLWEVRYDGGKWVES